jgi:hypothetical protein
VAQAGKKSRRAQAHQQTSGNTPKVQPLDAAQGLPGTPPPGSDRAAIPPPIAAELAQIERNKKWAVIPAEGKIHQTVKAIQVLRQDGFSTQEISEKLGIKPASIRQYMWIAGKNGWLNPLDPYERAHSELVHRAVSNAEEWLHARDGKTGLPDKEFTLEAMKGLGIFGSGPAQQSEQGHTNVLAINITMPTGGNLPTMRDGNAGGVGAYVDGEIVNASGQSRRQLPE